MCLTHGVLRNKRGVVWTDLVYGLSCFATDFAERRDAKFKGEFVAKYVPESTVSVETGRRKAGVEKSLLIPSSAWIHYWGHTTVESKKTMHVPDQCTPKPVFEKVQKTVRQDE